MCPLRAGLRLLVLLLATVDGSRLSAAAGHALPARALTTLQRDGYVIVPGWLPGDDAAAVLEDALSLQTADALHAAGVGGALGSEASGWAKDSEVRRSKTVWIQQPNAAASAPSPPSTRLDLIRTMEALRAQLTAEIALPLDGTATMMSYLYYPEGGYFRRHRDGPRTIWASKFREHREVSFLLYLDEGWRAEWGGALRIYPDRDPGTFLYNKSAEEETRIDVLPQAGTLVLMLSPQIEHEVLETRRPRHCVVGWFCAVVEQGRIQPARPLWDESEH